MITPDLQNQIIAEANLAPSVHNTQPTRWHFKGNTITLAVDLDRCLSVGDPKLRDAGLSAGAALEGTVMALKAHGYTAKVEDLWGEDDLTTFPGHRLASRVKARKYKTKSDSLAAFIGKRFTWRGKFEPISAPVLDQLKDWGRERDFIHLVTNKETIESVARLNDRASVKFFQNRPYRRELLSYMRLSESHDNYDLDGLNREAMQLSAIEAGAAGVILRFPVFETLSAIGLAKPIVSEHAKTCSASAIALFAAPFDTSPTELGRAFYRLWLEITEMGLAAWPMAVIADDPAINAIVSDVTGLIDNTLINAWRVGAVPKGAQVKPARFKVDDLKL